MKRSPLSNFLTLVIFCFPLISKCQFTNLVFFTEQGERFSVVLNGVLQNDKPETNVKITDLPAPSYKLKIIFENEKIPELDKTLMYKQGTETTFNIRKNNKGEYVARFFTSVPLAEALPPPPNQRIIVYTTTGPATTIVNQTQVNSTTINNTSVSAGDNANINVSSGGVSSHVNTSSTTISTSTSTQTSTVSAGKTDQTAHADHYIMPGYTGPIGCPYPMTDLDFSDAKQSIASKSFEDSKLTVAKQITSANCLFSSEVKEIMLLFDFEATRLTYAKFAYQYTFDKGNYYKVNDAFQFESSINELNQFTQGTRGK